MREKLVGLISELIRFRTIYTFPEEIQRCADFIENWLKELGAPVKRIEHHGVPSIMVIPESGVVPVLLMSHFDVVDAPAELFQPCEADGNLYGRGGLDDKYAVAVSLYLIKAYIERFKQQGLDLNGLPVGILITGDEETSGVNGAGEALKHLRADFCIALDGGNVNTIVVKEKGIIKLKLIASGKTAHGSRPWLGENAIIKLFRDYEKLLPLFEISASDHWHRTLNFSMIQAGKSFNQVPDYAEAIFDIRYTENDDPSELVDEIRGRISGEAEVIRIEKTFTGGLKAEYMNLLLEAAPGAVTGREHGASDARYLSEFGIDGVVWGADGDYSQHSAHEHVNIDSVCRLYLMLDHFLDNVSRLRQSKSGA